jgi:carboxypeptidase C (cathepsin A)
MRDDGGREKLLGVCAKSFGSQTAEANRRNRYVDVSENQHIFFWFIEARNVDPTTAPLTIWLNGGPGDPSMVGLFSENGPCSIDYDGNLQYNSYSWNNVSNVIYIDQVCYNTVPLPCYIVAQLTA